MLFSNVIEFTRLLISLDTVNPPGNEAVAAELTGTLLKENGFKLTNIPYGSNRHHLVAEKGCDSGKPILIFTGHFDTVPLGAKEWTVDPFGGETIDGKIYGRGSSDMKGGVAAMVGAAINAFAETEPQCGVKLLFTADEETGCKGAGHLVQQLSLQEEVIGIVVGEPTANVPAIGHKGGLYLKVTTSGKTAHSSMPHLGDNAIYKAAKAILKAEQFEFNVVEDDLLGFSTINVGRMQGGLNLNSVPDYAEFTIDARTTTKIKHSELLERLQNDFGREVQIEVLVDLPAVASSEDSRFVQSVYSACGIVNGTAGYPRSLPYLTDGAVLQSAYKGAPTVILGPGQPELAHKTDEFCYIDKIEQAVEIYKKIIITGGGYNG